MTKQAPARKKPKRVPPKPVFIVFVLLVILILVSLLGQSYFKRSKSGDFTSFVTPTLNEQAKIFRSSDVMDFEIKVPINYEVSEKMGSVTVLSENNEIILIGRNGTNFDNLEDYIELSRNNLKNRVTNQNRLTINGLNTVSGFIEKEKVYFIYTPYFVYILSTKNPNLYSTLDQIAKSFRYTPN